MKSLIEEKISFVLTLKILPDNFNKTQKCKFSDLNNVVRGRGSVF